MTDAPGSSEPQGNVLAKDLDGTFYIVPVEVMLQYAVNDGEILTVATRAWEAAARGEEVQAYGYADDLKTIGSYVKAEIKEIKARVDKKLDNQPHVTACSLRG